MRISTRLFLLTLLFMGSGVGLFVWGMTADLQAVDGLEPSAPMKMIGQVSGAIIGVGCVPLIAAIVLRLRGR